MHNEEFYAAAYGCGGKQYTQHNIKTANATGFGPPPMIIWNGH